jgi:hypothetical protein
MGVLSATYVASNGGSAAGFFLLFLVWIVLYIAFALGMYGSFQKAGQPGWAAFVPIYNFIIMLRIAGRPAAWAWFLLLAFVPFIGSIALLVVAIVVLNDISRSFGRGGGFTVGLVLLGPIFWYILWLGDSQYRGPAALAGAGGYPGQYPPPGYPPQQGGGYPSQSGYPPSGPQYPPPGPQYPPPGGQYRQPDPQYPPASGQQYPAPPEHP